MSDTRNRIIDTPSDIYFSEVEITEGKDWSDPEDADDDVETALGVTNGASNRTVHYHFWEGDGDADDFASLRIAKSGTATWKDYFGTACAFTSAPAEGSSVFFISAIVKDA